KRGCPWMAPTFSTRPVERSSSTVTSCPAARSASARCDPMKPAPPVISAFTARCPVPRNVRRRGQASKGCDGYRPRPYEPPIATRAVAETRAARRPRTKGCDGYRPRLKPDHLVAPFLHLARGVPRVEDERRMLDDPL